MRNLYEHDIHFLFHLHCDPKFRQAQAVLCLGVICELFIYLFIYLFIPFYLNRVALVLSRFNR